MGDFQKTGNSLHLIDLTDDNAASSSYHTTPYIDLTESDDRGTNHSLDIIDLSVDDNQYFISNIPVIDLTGNNDQFLNYRIPVIDLTGDDAQDITHQTQCVDLTYNDASSSNHNIGNFNLVRIDDRGINHSSDIIDLTHDDFQYFNPNTPVIDLTCDNDQFLKDRMQNINITNDVQDITHQLQNFDPTDGKQQNINDCIPTSDLKNHSHQNIDEIAPVTDQTSDNDCTHRRSVIYPLGNDKVIKKSVDDVEMYDLSSNNLHMSFQKDVIENKFGVPAENHSYNIIEKNDLKYNELVNMNVMHIDSMNSKTKFHNRKKILESHALKDNRERSTETILRNHSPTNKSEEKYLRSAEKSWDISRNDLSDFMKPARHPIPLRHSLGRSTVTTSKNVQIECREASEDESRILTVSSLIRRRKSKSATGTSEDKLLNSKELSTSRESVFSFETLKVFFWKFWLFLLLVFIGLYYWF